MGNWLYLPGNPGPHLNRRKAYAVIQVQVEWIKGGQFRTMMTLQSDFGEEDQMMKRQYQKYLAKLSTAFGYEDKKYDPIVLHQQSRPDTL